MSVQQSSRYQMNILGQWQWCKLCYSKVLKSCGGFWWFGGFVLFCFPKITLMPIYINLSGGLQFQERNNCLPVSTGRWEDSLPQGFWNSILTLRVHEKFLTYVPTEFWGLISFIKKVLKKLSCFGWFQLQIHGVTCQEGWKK